MLASSSRRTIETFGRRAASTLSGQRGKLPGAQAVQRRHASAQTKTKTVDGNTQPTTLRLKKPFPGTKPVQFHRGGSQLTNYNLRIRANADERRLRTSVQLALEMKREGVAPSIETYNSLLHGFSNDAAYEHALFIYNDLRRMQLQPTIETFNALLNAARFEPADESLCIFDEVYSVGLEPNNTTLELLLRRFVLGQNLEMSLQILAQMSDMGMSPSLKATQRLISLAAEQGYPRLALQLSVNFEETSIRRLEGEVWVDILASSAAELWLEGVLHCWKKLVGELRMTLHEGLCIAVLHTAARHGEYQLAAEALGQLEKLEVLLHEHHITPFLEAFCNAGRIKETFSALDLLRVSGAPMRLEAFSHIVKTIQRDSDAVDDAWGVLNQMKASGLTIDIMAVNIVIEACIRLGDLKRAVGIYKAVPDLGVKPDVTTYNLLFLACAKAQHRDLGDRIILEMTQASVDKDATTYEHLIKLCLSQTSYEDAFFHLETMKASGLKPTYAIYDAIVRKCLSSADERYKLAIEELLQMDYQVLPPLQSFINSAQTGDSVTTTRRPIGLPLAKDLARLLEEGTVNGRGTARRFGAQREG